MTARNLARKIAGFAFSKKAFDVQLLDLRKVSDVADFFVLCSADSDVQVKAIADAVLDGLSEVDVHPWHREGISQKQWILLDFVDVVVHVFHKDARKFYGLEKLWGDANIEALTDGEEPPPKEKGKTSAAKASATKASAPKAAPKAPAKKAASVKAPAARKPAARKTAARKPPKE